MNNQNDDRSPIVEEKEYIRPASFNEFSARDKRSLIFHILYAMESNDYQVTVASIVDMFNNGFELDIPLDSDVALNATAIIKEQDALDEHIKPLLTNWRPERISTITKLILRFAVWEFMYSDTDPKIIINEAIELAKCFAEDDAYKFINGILDRYFKQTPKK